MLAGRRVLIAGAAGKSGQAAAELCAAMGGDVFLADIKSDLPENSFLKAARKQGCRIENSGSFETEILQRIKPDLVVTAPGIPLTHPLMIAICAQGIELRSELDLAVDILYEIYEKKSTPAPPIVAITGTDGKSTTTLLLCEMIQAACQIPATPAGNFGLPLSHIVRAHLAQATGQTWMQTDLSPRLVDAASSSQKQVLVVECSSFQLELLHAFKPQIAILLNLAEDHLDRYANLDEYLQAKLNLLSKLSAADLCIVPPNLKEAVDSRLYQISNNISSHPRLHAGPDLSSQPGATIFYNKKALMQARSFARPGRHDRINLEFALIALADLDARFSWLHVDRDCLQLALQDFRGLPHRMEFLGEKCGLEFYNDSKATTVQAIEAALVGLEDRSVYLLMGGRAKGANFNRLHCFKNVSFYAYGEAGASIAATLDLRDHYTDLNTAFVAMLEPALQAAQTESKTPVVLLSPGCASYDAYKNFEERGEHFRNLVLKL